MQERSSFLALFISALLISASSAFSEGGSESSGEAVSPRCEAAIDEAAGSYSECLLKASAKHAKKENEEQLIAQQTKASPPLLRVQNGTQPLSIATGSAGWEYNRTGEKICSELDETDRFQCKAIVTRGSLQNIELLQDGKVNLALSQSDMIPDDSVDFISLKTLSRQALFIFVRKDSDIYGIHDLMHKRINAGPIGSGLRGTMNNVLKATGTVPSQASDVTAAQEAHLLCDNQTDAISFILDLDAPQVEQIEKTCHMRRLGFSRSTLEEVMRSNATYYPINLGPSGQEDAYAVGLYVDLVTYKGALSPEDHQLIIDSLRTMP